MAIRTTVEGVEGTYFITFTCQRWLLLFELTNSYDTVYKWFDHLKTNGHYMYILSFVTHRYKEEYLPGNRLPHIVSTCIYPGKYMPEYLSFKNELYFAPDEN